MKIYHYQADQAATNWGTAKQLAYTDQITSDVTISANNDTDETVYLTFVDGATGTQGLETDTGLTYNPSTGRLTANTFVGSATVAASITVADESSDTTCFPLFATAATGDLGAKTGSNLTFNSDTGILTATGFAGDVTGNVSGTAATVTGATQSAITTVGSSFTITGSNAAALNITATDGGSSPSQTTFINMTGYETRGQGIRFFDEDASGEEWFAGLRYSGAFDEYMIGYDASGGQSEYVANALLQVNKNGNVTASTFVGALTGNADTATKIASITNSDIVQLTASQTLTNKTIAVSQITELSNLTAAEGEQLENIGTTTISAAQWGYLGAATGAITNTDTQLSQAQVEDFAGGLFTGNTETFITATYQTGDNTVDLVVPVLDEDDLSSDSASHLATQQSIKAYVDAQTSASTVTVSDSTANTNFPVVFHNESNGLLDDTGALRYNPSTETLLVPNLVVAGTTTTVDKIKMEAANAVVFEGATPDAHETTLTITDPTADYRNSNTGPICGLG